MRHRLLRAAIDDLADIDAWVLEHFGSKFAAETQANFFRTFDLLAEFPHMGRSRPDVAVRSVRFFALKPYWIVYEPGTPLLNHRVYHAARDPARLESKP